MFVKFPLSFPLANFGVHNQHILFAQEYYMCLRHVAVYACLFRYIAVGIRVDSAALQTAYQE